MSQAHMLQVESSGHAIADLQRQIHNSQQQLPIKPQDASPSLSTSLESQLRAQISKSEYEVARQAAQILELQGELTKIQVSFDKSSQRQTETKAQLTRQESTASRHVANSAQLQQQLTEAKITAASQENRIGQLQTSLADSNSSLSNAKQRNSQLEEDLKLSQGLSAKHEVETARLKSQLSDEADMAATESACRAAAEADLRRQLKGQQAEHNQHMIALEQELQGLKASAAVSRKQEQALQEEVHPPILLWDSIHQRDVICF